jgi:hypothetical protein
MSLVPGFDQRKISASIINETLYNGFRFYKVGLKPGTVFKQFGV